ncbi:MAG: hypothetical protein AB7P00_25820 [Sandaracinaceae bacterium]
MYTARALAVAAFLVAMSATGPASAQNPAFAGLVGVRDDDPDVAPLPREPEPTRRDRTARIAMLAGGGGALALAWLTNAIGSSYAGAQVSCAIAPCLDLDYDPAWRTARIAGWVPLVGPWIQLAAAPSDFGAGWGVWWTVSGIVQLAGAIVLGVGLATSSSGPPDPVRVAVLPSVGPGEVGVALAGSFL